MSLSKQEFADMAADSFRLERFDEVRLQPSQSAVGLGQSILERAVDTVNSRDQYRGTATFHGSFSCGTNLSKPGRSDLDVMCYISKDGYGRPLNTLRDFEDIRKEASHSIFDYLCINLPRVFASAVPIEKYDGLSAKFQVQTHPTNSPWTIDFLYAYPAADYNETFSELDLLSRRIGYTNTNSLTWWRNDFVRETYDKNPFLKTLTRVLKYFNHEFGTGNFKRVNSFALEMLVIILFHNKWIPGIFDLSRALCTALNFIANPATLPIVKSNETNYPAHTINDLQMMRRNVGSDGLIVVDPVVPFNNLAARTPKTRQAWQVLTTNAQMIFQLLADSGVIPYELYL